MPEACLRVPAQRRKQQPRRAPQHDSVSKWTRQLEISDPIADQVELPVLFANARPAHRRVIPFYIIARGRLDLTDDHFRTTDDRDANYLVAIGNVLRRGEAPVIDFAEEDDV